VRKSTDLWIKDEVRASRCLRDQSLLGAKKIQEHSGTRINGRRQWSQREIGKAIAQDVVSYFIEQLHSTI
jgi:hypothetical protein